MTWVTAAPPLVTAVRSAKQYLTYVSAGPFQYAVAGAPYVRFAFCKRREILEGAAKRLRGPAAWRRGGRAPGAWHGRVRT